MFRFPVHLVLVLVENVWGPAETKKREKSEKQPQANPTHKYNTNTDKVLLHQTWLLKAQRLNIL